MAMAVVVSQLKAEESDEAYGFHRGFAGANPHLFPRSREHFSMLTESYQVVAAREDGEFVGMCYWSQNDDGEWELGGLMVIANRQGSGLGSILMRAALARLLMDINPLEMNEWVISHVLKGNEDPRGVIENRLKFRLRKPVVIPPHVLPGLPTEEDGMIHGDEFELVVPETLEALIEWCRTWPGTLRDGTDVELRFRDTQAEWAEAFDEMIEVLT